MINSISKRNKFLSRRVIVHASPPTQPHKNAERSNFWQSTKHLFTDKDTKSERKIHESEVPAKREKKLRKIKENITKTPKRKNQNQGKKIDKVTQRKTQKQG